MMTFAHLNPHTLRSCHCCGLVQQLPTLTSGQQAVCCRCGTPLTQGSDAQNQWTAALALAALAFYPPALLLPLLGIERLGHSHTDSLLAGLAVLFAEGYWLVGTVVLLFSVVLPPLKLLALWLLTGSAWIVKAHHRALLYRAVEAVGRWGMLDVMLVAILVAFVKLGDLVHISAGPALLAFTLMVLCSLFASLLFNPHQLWQADVGNENEVD